MQPDRYTKIVLTVIAVALLGLVAQNAIPRLAGVQKVAICDRSGAQCVPLYQSSILSASNGGWGLGVAVVNR